MAEGLSVAEASAQLGAIFQQTAHSVTALWIKLHVGAPGKAGTANPAANTTRKDATTCFGSAPVDNMDGTVSITSDAVVGPWLAVPATEVYSHYSAWTDPVAGSFVISGEVADGSVTAGDNWDAPIGSFVTTYAVAS